MALKCAARAKPAIATPSAAAIAVVLLWATSPARVWGCDRHWCSRALGFRASLSLSPPA
ncbi:hypothetical protein IQ265_05620 [Nodosilinea sp. LEGE 06152]|uniref:hypothetical protein n=1 Tax=Nodosilinea sp. LEGE 06152 TaxID=2777966 RepID=UPI00187DE1E5|nr:hypothetical protein [Nodosilinea sp. LEGE 06152]MBE9156310.1 hypothetical protein [Nodosilinea sp. LEGE 06152]